MKPKIFIDTNVINNKKPYGGLFGNTKLLSEIEAHAEIFIPKIVKQEILEHKRRAFEAEKQALIGNQLFAKLFASDPKMLAIIQEEQFCEPCALLDEEIAFTEVEISDWSKFIEEMLPLALRHQAPFDKDSDKGFKDAMVAYTIQEYLDKNPQLKCPIFFVTSDARLGEYFQNNPRVIWRKNLKELNGIWDKLDQEKIQETGLGQDQCPEKILDNDGKSVRLTSARRLLTDLRNSGNFATTHDIIAKLQSYIEDLTEEDKIDVLLSALNNSQIMLIVNDPDVKSFVKPFFNEYKNRLEMDKYNDFVRRSGWKEYPILEPIYDDVLF